MKYYTGEYKLDVNININNKIRKEDNSYESKGKTIREVILAGYRKIRRKEWEENQYIEIICIDSTSLIMNMEIVPEKWTPKIEDLISRDWEGIEKKSIQ